MRVKKTFALYLFMLSFLLHAEAQTGKFNDTFDKNNGWKFSVATDSDSADIACKDGSLILDNRHATKKVIAEYTPSYTGINWSSDDEWEVEFEVRHLSGVTNYEYGICIGAKPQSYLRGGLSIGISSNGYYKVSYINNNKITALKEWTAYSPIKTKEGEVNKIRVIKRLYSNLYLIINGKWAFLGRPSYIESNTFAFYADASQQVAIDNITAKSFKGTFNKVEHIRIADFIEVCKQSENNFEFAKGFEAEGKFKTWLAPITITNKEYLIFARSSGIFPRKKDKTNQLRYLYTITSNYNNTQDSFKADERIKLTNIIEKGLEQFDKTEKEIEGRKYTYYFNKNPNLPKGVVAILEEYTEKEINYLSAHILCAPDIKPF